MTKGDIEIAGYYGTAVVKKTKDGFHDVVIKIPMFTESGALKCINVLGQIKENK